MKIPTRNLWLAAGFGVGLLVYLQYRKQLAGSAPQYDTRLKRPRVNHKEKIDTASIDSFPASDAPAY